MHTTIQQWGNSLALRIPRSMAREVQVQRGSVVDLALVKGKLVVKPKRQRKYSLSKLLKGVTKSNRHPELDWGRAVGRETW